jgi:hypothetical protein
MTVGKAQGKNATNFDLSIFRHKNLVNAQIRAVSARFKSHLSRHRALVSATSHHLPTNSAQNGSGCIRPVPVLALKGQ